MIFLREKNVTGRDGFYRDIIMHSVFPALQDFTFCQLYFLQFFLLRPYRLLNFRIFTGKQTCNGSIVCIV